MNFIEVDPEIRNQTEQNGTSLSICLNTNPSSGIDNKGILFISCIEDGEKTNPDKITEWFSEEFIKMHKVYAIREEEAFLLKIYTRDREVANKVLRKKGGRKPMLLGQEVHGEIIVACGRCGYRSNEGSNVRRHLKRSVCARDRGYSKKELDGLNRSERQKFIRRIASAKFRAKKKLEAVSVNPEARNGEDGPMKLDSGRGNPRSRLKPRKKSQSAKALTLGPLVENEAVKRVSFDVFTVNEHNFRVAWKPPFCHKASDDTCQIVFKGARMRRRCLDLPLPIILTYRKLDCKVHHCNFTLFHPHARKAFNEDSRAKMSLNVRTYGDTVMTQEFYHHFVSLLTVMKMKSSQCARHLTSVWETILSERLQTTSVPEESHKIITLSKQTVKSIWSSIEEEAGHKNPVLLTRTKKKRVTQPQHSEQSTVAPHPSPVTQNQEFNFSETASLVPPNPVPSAHEAPTQQHPQAPHHHQLHHPNLHHPQVQSQQPQPQIFQQQQACLKRYAHVIPKPPPTAIPVSTHPLSLPHSHTMLQGTPHPHHWVGTPVGQTHPVQYPANGYHAPPPHEEYYSVQASFVAQYTPSPVLGTSS